MIYHAVIVAGANGAGKSTFARRLIERSRREYVYLNADDIARELPSSTPNAVRDRLAGQQFLRRLAEAVNEHADFMIETTLAGLTYANHIRSWHQAGYRTTLHYLRLNSVEESIDRVRKRVAEGGHGIPEFELRRRFPRSLSKFENLYSGLVHEWYIYDSLEGNFLLVGEGRNL